MFLALLAAGLMSVPAEAAEPEPFRIGVRYDLSKAYTFATPQVSQAARQPATRALARSASPNQSLPPAAQ